MSPIERPPDGPSESSKPGDPVQIVRHRKELFIQQGPGLIFFHICVTIGSLPDNVLLEIFDFYRVASEDHWEETWEWHRLVHVCQRWRYVIFGSPLRLNLQLRCTLTTPVRATLDVWPPLPLVINNSRASRDLIFEGQDDIIAALEHRDRISQIILLDMTSSLLEQIVTAMQESFPALTVLSLWLDDEVAPGPVLPDVFLAGSAPCLQALVLDGISFPSLPKLLLSASDLVTVRLWNIPNAGYISPEAMATCLSTLTKLESLVIVFGSPTPRSTQRSRHPPPLTRAVLPTLTWFKFEGISEYLESLVARIDTPVLDSVEITFFNQLVFDTPQLTGFVSRAEWHKSPDLWLAFLTDHSVHIAFDCPEEKPRSTWDFELKIHCDELDWQVSSITQICTQSFSYLCSSVEQLNIYCDYYVDGDILQLVQQYDVDPMQWLELFQLFTSVQMLHTSEELLSFIGLALQQLTEATAMDVFPALHTIFLVGDTSDEYVQQAMEPFITARQHSSHAVAVHRCAEWDVNVDFYL